MLTVDTIGWIRREYFVGKRPIREIPRSLKVSHEVIRKAIRTPTTELSYICRRRVQPQLGSFVERLDQLLEENMKRSARETSCVHPRCFRRRFWRRRYAVRGRRLFRFAMLARVLGSMRGRRCGRHGDVASSVFGAVVDVSDPCGGIMGVVGKAGDGEPETLIAGPSEHDAAAFTRGVGNWADAGLCGELIFGGEAFAYVAQFSQI